MSKELLVDLERAARDFDLKAHDLLSIEDLSVSEIHKIFELTKIVEVFLKGEMKKVDFCKGKTLFNFFLENSTRTRSSFELAAKNLSIDTINLSGSESSLEKGETLLDTAITLDQMQPDVIVMRAGASGAVKYLAENVHSAVINAGDGWNEHPTQALLDLYTMIKYSQTDLQGKKLLIVGDVLHSRVFGSLVRGAKMFGMKIVVTAPETLIRPEMDVLWGVEYIPIIEDALIGADFIYVLRLQTERAATAFVPTLREYSKTYGVNMARLQLANSSAFVMHPGPVIRELDVHTNILETERSLVDKQVYSGYCVRFVLLWLFANKRKVKKVVSRGFKEFKR